MNKKNILLIFVIIVLISLINNVFGADIIEGPADGATAEAPNAGNPAAQSTTGFQSWPASPTTQLWYNQLTTEQKDYITQQGDPTSYKIENNNVVLLFPVDRADTSKGNYQLGSTASSRATAPQDENIPHFTPKTPAAGGGTTGSGGSGGQPGQLKENEAQIVIDGVNLDSATGKPRPIIVDNEVHNFLTDHPNDFELVNPRDWREGFRVTQTSDPQVVDKFLGSDVSTTTTTTTIVKPDNSRDVSVTEETFEYDSDKKKPLTNKPVSKVSITSVSDKDGVITQQNRDIFEPRGANFEKKGSVNVGLEHGESWFGGAYRVRTSTEIKDASGATLFKIMGGKVFQGDTDVEVSSKEFSDIKAKLGKQYGDQVRQEFVDGIMESRANVGTKFRAMDWSQALGGFIRSYNEFSGLAHITNLALDKDYEEKVAKRKLQNSQRFCALAGIGYCFVSKICDKHFSGIGGNVVLAQRGNNPNIGIARITGEKSPPMTTPKGTQYLYTVNFHLENPSQDEVMTYNVYFIGSGEKKWYGSDQTLNKTDVVVVNQASDKPVRKLTSGNYDRVCLRFNPSIYKFGSKLTTNEACDNLIKTPEEVTDEQTASVTAQKGTDGDI